MAKIKTMSFSLNGESITINLNCNKDGIFSAATHIDIAREIGLKHNEIRSKDIDVVERYFRDAFIAYNEAKKERSLCIGISFGASGAFIQDESGHDTEVFLENKSIRNFGRENSISFDYDVLIKETFSGRSTYFLTRKYTGDPNLIADHDRFLDGYLETRTLIGDGGYSAIIPYSEKAISNLKEIEDSFRKASQFLAHLISSQDVELLLNENTNRILPHNP